MVAETLVLRAEITNDPDGLIGQTLDAIASGQSPHDELVPQQLTSAVELRRLDHLVSYEAALRCARERWDELGEATRVRLREFALSIAAEGTVLEQVRVVRGFSGLPVSFSYPLLHYLASSPSDWLVGEVLKAVKAKEHRTPEFASIVGALVDATKAEDFIQRLLSIGGISIWNVLCTQGKRSARVLLATLGRIGLYWVFFVAFVLGAAWFGSGVFDATAFDARFRAPGQWWRPLVQVSLLGMVVTWLAGWRQATVSLTAFGALLLILPPISAFRYYSAACIYLMFIGPEFRRATWLSPGVLRSLELGRRLHPLFRVIVTYLIGSATAILINYYRMEDQATSAQLFVPAGVALALLVELGVWYSGFRRLRRLSALADRAVEEVKIAAVVDRYIRELRRLWPARISRTLIGRLTDLRTGEEILISRLKDLADSREFFVKSDQILEAIERLDVRRRQKPLQDPQLMVPPAKTGAHA